MLDNDQNEKERYRYRRCRRGHRRMPESVTPGLSLGITRAMPWFPSWSACSEIEIIAELLHAARRSDTKTLGDVIRNANYSAQCVKDGHLSNDEHDTDLEISILFLMAWSVL